MWNQALALGLLAVLSKAAPAPVSPAAYDDCPKNEVMPDGKLPSDSFGVSKILWISPHYYRFTSQFKTEVHDTVRVRAKNKDPDKYLTSSGFNDVICSIYEIGISKTRAKGKWCNLVFDFPHSHQAPGLWDLHGTSNGTFTLQGYEMGYKTDANTTWFNQPPLGPSPDPPVRMFEPRNNYLLASMPCNFPEDAPEWITVAGRICSDDYDFDFLPSNRLCPLGFFVILTDPPEGAAEAASDSSE